MTSEVDALIERLRGMLEDASPRPWRVSESGATVRAGTTRVCFGHDGNRDRRAADWSLITESVNAITALLDLIAAQREELEAIARGEYDGLEVHPHSAAAGRAIARRALGRGE